MSELDQLINNISPSSLLNTQRIGQPGGLSVSTVIPNIRTGLNAVDQSIQRLAGQIGFGGTSVNPHVPVSESNVSTNVIGQPRPLESDWRVTIGFPSKSNLVQYYYTTLLSPLIETNGVVFPYTPQITVNYTADWQGTRLTHSNYTPQFYHASEIQDMQIQGTFTAANTNEALYVLAVLTFGRLVTKMFFGTGDNVGNPPPILHLSGYGEYNFNKTPVILKSFNYTLPSDVDYISISNPTADVNPGYGSNQQQTQNSTTRIPTEMNIMFTVLPIYSRKQLTEFSYSDFANGSLIQKGLV